MAQFIDWDAYDSDDILNPTSCFRQVAAGHSQTKKPNVFNYFVRIQAPEFRKNNAVGFNHKDMNTQLGAMWKALTDEQKTEYEFHFKKTPFVSLNHFLSGGRPEWLPTFPLRASIAHLL